MRSLKSQLRPSDSVQPEDRKMISMAMFYQAEKKAFSISAVKGSFEEVGLYPWNREKIFDHCKKFCGVQCQQDMDRAYIALAEAVKQHHEKQLSECCKIVSEMRPVTVASLKMIEKQKCHDEDDVEDQQEEDESYSVPKPRKARDILTQSPQKTMSSNDSNCQNMLCKWVPKNSF